MTKILLVEDDKSLREIYGVRLIAEGYNVVSAEDGEKALAVAISERPDLIISDVMMPKISGFEMLDLLRGNESTKNVKVIMLTALSSEQQRERGERLGADRYLVKSQVGIEDIVRTVHEVLGDQQGVRTLSQIEESARAANLAQHSASQANAQSNGYSTQPSVSSSTNIVNQNDYTMPSAGQSAYNPLAATAPASVAGQPAPQMPAQPMNIPTYSNQPPVQTASYGAAMQAAVAAAEQLNAFSNPNELNSQNRPQITTDGVNTTRAAQSTANISSQSLANGASSYTLPQVQVPQLSQTAQPQNSFNQTANQPATAQSVWTTTQSQQPSSAYQTSSYQPNGGLSDSGAPTDAHARAVSNYQPNVPLGERVIQPPAEGSSIGSPKIDINALLSEQPAAGSSTNPMFPS